MQGKKAPWRLYQNYLLDSLTIRLARIRDPELEFSRQLPQRVEKERAETDSQRQVA